MGCSQAKDASSPPTKVGDKNTETANVIKTIEEQVKRDADVLKLVKKFATDKG